MFLYLQDWCNINVVIKTIANDDTCTRHVKSVICCTCNNNYADSEIDIVRRFIFKVKWSAVCVFDTVVLVSLQGRRLDVISTGQVLRRVANSPYIFMLILNIICIFPLWWWQCVLTCALWMSIVPIIGWKLFTLTSLQIRLSSIVLDILAIFAVILTERSKCAKSKGVCNS